MTFTPQQKGENCFKACSEEQITQGLCDCVNRSGAAPTPTAEQYKKAKLIVDAYEAEQKRLYELNVEAFRKDLQEYFKNNLIDGNFRIEEFELRDSWLGSEIGDIVPIKPTMEGYYDGGNNEDIKRLSEKHNVNYSFASWCYPK